MSADWSKPTTTSLYSSFVTELDDRLDDLALQFSSGTITATNLPTNAIRWNSSNSNWERYTASSWTGLASTYGITVNSATSWASARNLVLSGDGSATLSSVNGSSNVTATLTLSSIGTATTVGSTTVAPIVAINAKGLVTSLTAATLGTMASQASTNVSITGGAIGGVTFTAKHGTTGSNVEGVLEWSTSTNTLMVGDGAAVKTMIDTNSAQTMTSKTLTSPTINTPVLTLDTTASTTAGRLYYSGGALFFGNGSAGLEVDTLTGTQTLTNKTLTSPTINTPTLTLSTSASTTAGRLYYSGGALFFGNGSTGLEVVTLSSTQTLTNKTLTSPTISSINNGGTVTIPSGADTLVNLTSSQTLTNKTLTSPAIGGTPTGNIGVLSTTGSWTAAQRGSLSTLSIVTGTITPDLSLANNFIVTLTGSTTFANPTNLVNGQSGIIEVVQSVSGNCVANFTASSYKFVGGTDIVLSTAASARDLISYYTFNSTIFLSIAKDVK